MKTLKFLLMENDRTRLVWMDWLRVAACFMVMVVHSTEPFYLGGDGSLVLTRTDAFWVGLFDSFVRACVPLFVVASSFLQFPVKYTTGEFFRRRAARILVPFLIWSVVYALAWGDPVHNLKDLFLNFNYAAGHLWFVYMLVGMYILMPLLSPWAEKVGRKELRVYLGIWLFTTLIPFFREWLGGEAPMMYGPSGIPMQVQYPLWGECCWNPFGTFYYMSGFIGYMLLGLYFRKFAGELSWGRTLALAIPCLLGGYAIAAGGFIRRLLDSAAGIYPVSGTVGLAAVWETTITFCSLGVVLMTVGWILLFRKVKSGGAFYNKVILPLSRAGYGMYLCHMLILASFSTMFRSWLGIGTAGVLGVWTTPVEIALTAACSFVCVGVSAVLVRRVPRIGPFIMG